MCWKAETFETASWHGPVPHAGYTYRGLGLWLAMKPSPKGRRPAEWWLVHLGTGHALARLRGDVKTVFPVASELAEAGEWDFLSLEGWKDRFPDAALARDEWAARHPKIIVGLAGGRPNQEVARAVAMSRP